MNEADGESLGPNFPKIKVLEPTSDLIKSTNKPSLHSAMGDEKFKAFRWGEGLDKVPEEIKESLIASGLTNASYSYSEYLLEGKLKRHLFIDKRLENGTQCIYVTDLDKSLPYVFGLDNLYVLDNQGKTIDLLEEVQSARSYFVPIAYAGYMPSSNLLLFGDISKLGQVAGLPIGIDSYIHEIGHEKDLHTGNQETSWFYTSSTRIQDLAVKLNRFAERHQQKTRIGKVPFFKFLMEEGENYGRQIIQMEKNAQAFANYFINHKRASGINLIPGRTKEESEAIDAELLSYYEVYFLEGGERHFNSQDPKEDKLHKEVRRHLGKLVSGN